MISQEQYDQLNEGDTVTARYEALRGEEDFEAKGKVYVLSGTKFFAGWNLQPGVTGDRWAIIEHIPATPAWHSALVIGAEVDGEEGRFLFVRVRFDACPWYSPELRDSCPPGALSDVKILVDKDVEL